MWDRIREIIKHVVLLSLGKNKLEKKQGQYELLGVDIMLDTSLNPYLLELNTNPALFTDTTT
jgi:glutathione synthase/RimK-type ligase-like ATP-grasp enzyme